MIWMDNKLYTDFHFKRDASTKIFSGYEFEEEVYTVEDTGLTHRQINSLGTEGLIPEKRQNKQKWRKFSFLDLVYLRIIEELRTYGIKNKQLEDLQRAFYEPSTPAMDYSDGYIAINLALAYAIKKDGNYVILKVEDVFKV